MNVKMKLVAQGCALALAAAVAHAEIRRSQRSFQDHEVVVEKELLITAPEVVDSRKTVYPGPWSFGFLMEEAFTEVKAPRVVAGWLEAWAEGDEKADAPPRPGVRELIRRWRHRDGHRTADGDWEPNFENAPFRLLAIVNRMDLSLPLAALRDEDGEVETPVRSPSLPYYANGGSLFADSTAGEGRFVFAVLDGEGELLDGGTTLILEYGLHAGSNRENVLNWAMDWHALGKFDNYDGHYLAALASITGRFTRPNRIDPEAEDDPALRGRLRNASPTQLLRIRTNDGSFGAVREFREFGIRRISEKEGIALRAVPVAGTPRVAFFEKGTRENRWLARWLRREQRGDLSPANARGDVLRERQFNMAFPATVRLDGESIPVVAMAAPVPGNNANYHWDAHSMNASYLRRAFSMQTCCGCHCGDTATRFFHIEPRPAGKEASLSRYLARKADKVVIRDPASRRQVKLQEMEERRIVFEEFLNPGLTNTKAAGIRERRRERAH